MKFLDETSALVEIRSMLVGAKQAKLAVAFWGRGAAEQLGLNREGLALSVICNLESGACNPAEIGRILKHTPERVRTDPRLHAKVYWTPERAVVGSSNASTNGLAVSAENVSGWFEANVLIDDPVILKDIEMWFDGRWAKGAEITPDILENALKLWNDRSRASPPGIPLNSDLIAAYRASPRHPVWLRVRVIMWTIDTSEAGKREAAREIKKNPALKDFGYYEDCKDIQAGEWLIDFKVTPRNAQYKGISKAPSTKIESANLTFVNEFREVNLRGFAPMTLEKSDIASIAPLGTKLLESFSTGKEGYALVSLADFVKEWDKLAAPGAPISPDPAAFEQILRSAYEQAKALGYNASGFNAMLSRRGGVETAKELLNNRSIVPDGFVRLAVEGRLDLSVEYIVLRPEWAGLFTEKELSVARRRLARR